MIGNDLVSIGLPTYNGALKIRRALDSLLSQTYQNIELIISDNASTDDTREICAEYASRDKRIRYIRQKENIGQFQNFPFVLRNANGKYFMWTADDDWWDPRFIEILKNALDARPSYGVAMSSYARVYDDGEFLAETSFDGKNNITNLSYGKVLEMMMKRAPIHKFSYGLFRTELLKKLANRQFPKCIAWERAYMCEVALSTHFYSYQEVLYKITTYRKSLAERHGATDVAKAYFNRFHYTKYVFTTIGRVSTSPIVPFYRKITILPVAALKLLWFGKGRILHEFSPVLYKLLSSRIFVTE